MFNSRLLVLTPLLVAVIFAVLTSDLYSSIMIQAQRPGSVLTTNNPNNPFGGAYESPPNVSTTTTAVL